MWYLTISNACHTDLDAFFSLRQAAVDFHFLPCDEFNLKGQTVHDFSIAV